MRAPNRAQRGPLLWQSWAPGVASTWRGGTMSGHTNRAQRAALLWQSLDLAALRAGQSAHTPATHTPAPEAQQGT